MRLSANRINALLADMPDLTTFLESERDNINVKLVISDVTVLPTAMEARLKLSLSGNPRNSVIGSYLSRNGKGTNEGTNYVRTSGKFIFHPEELTDQYITVPLKGNNLDGNDIQVVVSSTITGAQIADAVGLIKFSNTIPADVKPGFRLDWETDFINNGFEFSDSGFKMDGSPCWRSRPAHGRTQPGNKELGLYVDPVLFPGTDPFPIIDGKRILRADKLATPIRWTENNLTQDWNYTASMITSQRLPPVQVGDRVECRYALPVNGKRAAWPAFWLLEVNGNWNVNYREIDVLEQPVNAQYNPFIYYTTQHFRSSSGSHQQISYPLDIRTLGITTDLTQPHTYAVEIDAQELRFEIDGKKTCVMENRAETSEWYVLLNMAFGGTWPGSPTAETTYPCDMILDWIRFYKPA